MEYYTLEIHLKEDIPMVGLSASINFTTYEKTKDFVSYFTGNGFAIEDLSFGTVIIMSHQIKYAHAYKVEGVEMPQNTQIFRTVKNISSE